MSDPEVEAAIEAEIDKIQQAVTKIVGLRNPEMVDDPPYVQAWVVSGEWTNIELDQNGRYGHTRIHPSVQAHSTTLGLARLLKASIQGA